MHERSCGPPWRAKERSTSREEAQSLLAGLLPEPVAGVLEPRDLALIEEWLRQMPEPQEPRLTQNDWRGAVAVFLLVFLSTFGRLTHRNAWRWGVSMVAIGVALSGITMMLGG